MTGGAASSSSFSNGSLMLSALQLPPRCAPLQQLPGSMLLAPILILAAVVCHAAALPPFHSIASCFTDFTMSRSPGRNL